MTTDAVRQCCRMDNSLTSVVITGSLSLLVVPARNGGFTIKHSDLEKMWGLMLKRSKQRATEL
jgi:hypothetical protein